MIKKFKLLFSFLLITLITICLCSSSKAATYTPKQLFPHVKWDDTSNTMAVFCREKGGALRLHSGLKITEEMKKLKKTDTIDKYVDGATKGKRIESLKTGAGGFLAKELKDYLTLADEYSAYKPTTDNGKITRYFSGDTNNQLQGKKPTDTIRTETRNGETVYIGASVATAPNYEYDPNKMITVGDVGNGTPAKGHMIAYIMSSAYNDDGTINVSKLDTVQNALWMLRSEQEGLYEKITNEKIDPNDVFNEGRDLFDGEHTTEGANLLLEARDFKNFYKDNNTAGGYANRVKIKQADDIKLIVNNKDKTYTVGPFILNYPNTKFDSITDISVYDEKNSKIEATIIHPGGTGVPGNNQQFFVKFSYESNPKSISLKASFDYLKCTYAKYIEIEGKGKIQHYEGTISIDDKTTKKEGEDKYKGTLIMNATIVIVDDENGYKPQKGALLLEGKRIRDKAETEILITFDLQIMQIGGSVFLDSYESKQTEANGIFDEGKDKKLSGINVYLYEVEYRNENDLDNLEVSQNSSNKPTQNSKTDKYDVKQDFSKPYIKHTRTAEDGTYVFKDLNPLNKYYVRFEYNGQYYEPTYYTSPNVVEENYKKTSNGTEYERHYTTGNKKDRDWVDNEHSIENNRQAFNNLFGTIGTGIGRDNYKSQTYNKRELMGLKPVLITGSNPPEYEYRVDPKEYVIIDEYGNLLYIEEENELIPAVKQNGELKRVSGLNAKDKQEVEDKIQFVKNCKMNSWTKNLSFDDESNAPDKLNLYSSSEILIITPKHSLKKDIGDKLKKAETELTVETTTYTGNADDFGGIRDLIAGKQNDKSQYINQGLVARPDVDFELMEDLYSAELRINGKSQTFMYGDRENSENGEGNWEISVRLSDEGYYTNSYERAIELSDYKFKVSDYGDYASLGKSKDDELKIFVTYYIKVHNSSDNVNGKIDEIVHYFDEDYTYKEGRIEYQNRKYDKICVSDTSVKDDEVSKIDGYKTLYIRGLRENDIWLKRGDDAYIYLTFEVNKKNKNGESWIKLDENPETGDEIGVGKESISEINGYTTRFVKDATKPRKRKVNDSTISFSNTSLKDQIAGLIDRDSTPGNLLSNTNKYKESKSLEGNMLKDLSKDITETYRNIFEDDTDKAPNLKIIIKRDGNPRIISGCAWEDQRVKNSDGVTFTGNGIREDKETLINGVTVQLIEITQNGKEYLWREFGSRTTGPGSEGDGKGTGLNSSETPIINYNNRVQNYSLDMNTGKYAFTSFIPGDYIVRFKYGDTYKTVLTSTNGDVENLLGKSGANAKSYNGQDYKTTVYQAGLGTYTAKEDINSRYGYNKGNKYDILKSDTGLYSDAKDLYDVRKEVIDYSNGEVKNSLAEELVSFKNANTPNLEAKYKNFIKNTAMTAETGRIDIGIEYPTDPNKELSLNKTKNKNKDKQTSQFHLANLDIGLEERPRAQIEINKDVQQLTITLADQTLLFDSTQSADNLLWKTNPMDGRYLGKVEMDKDITRYYGLIQPTMDKELMHGATIKVVYKITARNIGEVDYKDMDFYYTGKVPQNTSTMVKTTPLKLVDYVPNNMKYYATDNNSTWKVETADDLIKTQYIRSDLKDKANKVNVIVTTDTIEKALVPAVIETGDNKVSTLITLTQTITSENKSDNMEYVNLVELISYKNDAGRRMELSIVGNQDPSAAKTDAEFTKNSEIDADIARVRVMPPFGARLTSIIISIITIAGASIIIVGIVFIKKKVLKK